MIFNVIAHYLLIIDCDVHTISNFPSIANLGCGYQGSGLVCCPQTSQVSNVSPGKMVDGQRCGIAQVQGDGYDSIGAYPWVVRVGFRS